MKSNHGGADPVQDLLRIRLEQLQQSWNSTFIRNIASNIVRAGEVSKRASCASNNVFTFAIERLNQLWYRS
jgi:hypothetical protein